ncbi:MAG: helix-turn-helix transcriptional regulator [Bacilli bacterium]|nr:helix-turn-helix transcriptional regulator [Bacilli bacterium]
MKFGDKLILLRKKNGLSQEELASKLNVSRQSVSKWESNNTYPETDKIIQICNLFDCRMDDLINDKVNDIEQIDRKSKNNLAIVFDSFLEFVIKTINMFSSMKFTSILKCVVELGILILILFVCGLIISSVCINVIMDLVGFLSRDFYYSIYNIVQAIIEIVLICFSGIIVVHVFKIRYLDFYDKALNDENTNFNKQDLVEENSAKSNKSEKENNKVQFNTNKEPKIIIRDKHTTFAFLTTLSKIIVGIFKAFVAVVSCCFVGTLVSIVALLVVSVFLSKYSILFVGADIGLIGIGIINVIILICLTYFIVNKKIDFKKCFFAILSSLVAVGLGIGLGAIGITEFSFKDDIDGIKGNNVSKELEKDVVSNLVIDVHDMEGYTIRIDNSMSDDIIKVVGINHEKFFKKINSWSSTDYGMRIYSFHNSSYLEFNEFINVLNNDLENKIFRSYYSPDGKIEIVCNEKIAKKLIDNAKKIYLVDYEKTDYGYKVNSYEQKIYLDYSCEMEYDARNGEYSYDDNCVCTKEVRMAPNGELIDFDCKYKDE